MPELSAYQWLLVVIAAVLVGFSKTGFPGLGMVIVPILAMVFPARASVGILLPMLIMGDVFGVAYYRRHAVLKHLVALLPWVLLGIVAGYFFLDRVDNRKMRLVLGILILALAVLQLLRQRFAAWVEAREKEGKVVWIVAGTGVSAGFATMIANAAGSIMSLHLLAQKMPKKEFMGTGAWFYLSINLIKVPLSASLGLITVDSLKFNLSLFPAIMAGALAGIVLLPRIPQKIFEKAMLILAVLAGIRLLLAGL